ncbi:MAG: single-stranded-DNA-specific exonuclease RecJ [Treponema sp.]|jgi:single-stranded-DNA-specific exonuclease|nr:single-stranded-DNA-specific exonuclease RecJ [Treponema sp.]
MKWEKKNIPQGLAKEIAAKYKCDQISASILARKGIINGGEIKYFLEDALRFLHNPFDIPNMEDAVERILEARDEGEKVLVFGDRDVDGMTSTALLTNCLRQLGIDTQWRIPIGDEPYGLSITAVEEFAAGGGALIITVDCGISNFSEVKRAAELNIDVIITDHHNPQDETPSALAIVNPKLSESRYPFRDLAGCGVAYKLVSALRFALKSSLFKQSVCLFNIRPANDSYVIELVKLRNLSVVDRLTEIVVPGVVHITQTRLPAFLESQQIFVWDARMQKAAIAKIFGKDIEVQMWDAAPEIAKELPSTTGKSLLRLREESSIARYSDMEFEEIDVFVNLFISFVQKKEKLFTEDDRQDLQLACLGTIADIMPLRDENRIIVKAGLDSMQKNPRPGLDALLFKLDLAGRRLTSNDLGWTLCPAINAAGRMGSPERAVHMLLLEEDKYKLADELVDMNKKRKEKGEETWARIKPIAEKSLSNFDHKFTVVGDENIFRGVTGIMANRMADYFKTPALVASFGGGVVTGSLRSNIRDNPNFTLTPILEECAELFIDKGGHDYAAGFSMRVENWEPFLKRLKNRIVPSIEPAEQTEEVIFIDAELPPAYLNFNIMRIIDLFEPYGGPYGSQNEQLTFLTRGVSVQDIAFMGKNGANHVKLTVDTGKNKWTALYWNAADRVQNDFNLHDRIDIVFKITRNFYKGTETPQIEIRDLRREKMGDE